MRLLKHEADHYGKTGLQRIIFAGLSEVDEPEICKAMRMMYGRSHRLIRGQVVSHRNRSGSKVVPDETISAWAVIGLGNLANIGRELELHTDRERKKIFGEAGRLLLDDKGK